MLGTIKNPTDILSFFIEKKILHIKLLFGMEWVKINIG